MTYTPVRAKRGRATHALPMTGDGARMMCGRALARPIISQAFPTCKRCLAAIARLSAC